jgi:hypothetical protein
LQLFDDGEIGIKHVQGLLREVAHIQTAEGDMRQAPEKIVRLALIPLN